MNPFVIQEEKSVSDGIGGHKQSWVSFTDVEGYLDLITGTNNSYTQNAFIEDSTHVLIIPDFTPAITDNMRIVDQHNRFYLITYVDNPVGVNHHNEVYCKYGGVVDGQG